MAVTFTVLSVFFAAIVAVLYVSRKRTSVSSFSNYAVGERSFSSWFVSMAYTNSWWPGATFTAWFGLGIASGLISLYALVYSVLGVIAMYLIARPVWRWGKKFDLRTQSDLLALRYHNRGIKTTSSVVSVIALFPWLVLGLQAMGSVIQWASFGRLPVTTSILIGVAVIAIRQIWTIQMGMRGLIITDMVQGIVAYLGSAVLCVGLILFYFHGFQGIHNLGSPYLRLPGFSSALGGWYYFSLIASGMIGSLCWPMIFVRIYAAGSVREVKKGTLQTMAISLVFYGLLILVATATIPLKSVTSDAQSAWFALNNSAGGPWLLAIALVIVFAATMGFVDGVVQSMGTQVANDIVGVVRPLRDKQEIVIAKIAMVVFVAVSVIVAYRTYFWSNLVDLGQVSYEAIIQLAVPIFGGLFWRRGNSTGALAAMVIGTALAIGLSIPYFADAGTIPWLGGISAGLVGLAANLVIYVACGYFVPASATEQGRVAALFSQIQPHPAEVPPDPAPATAGDTRIS